MLARSIATALLAAALAGPAAAGSAETVRNPLRQAPVVPTAAPALIFPTCPTGFKMIQKGTFKVVCEVKPNQPNLSPYITAASLKQCGAPWWNDRDITYQMGIVGRPYVRWTCRHI